MMKTWSLYVLHIITQLRARCNACSRCTQNGGGGSRAGVRGGGRSFRGGGGRGGGSPGFNNGGFNDGLRLSHGGIGTLAFPLLQQVWRLI